MKGKVTYLYNNNMKRSSSSDFYVQAYIFLSYPSNLYETTLSF